MRRVDCNSKKALLLVTEQDIGKISEISLGQAKLLAAAIGDMRDTATTRQDGPAPESPNDTEGNGQSGMGHDDPTAKNDPVNVAAAADANTTLPATTTLAGIRTQATQLHSAGEEFDSLFRNCPGQTNVIDRPGERMVSSSFGDPRSVLTVKSRAKKALHITDFLSDKLDNRRRMKQRDVVVAQSLTGEGDNMLALRSDDNHPYRGISLDEWNSANVRLLSHLLATQELARADIEYYLAYTSIINDFYGKYEWSSILTFDHAYREQQAAHSFMWGQINPLMELQVLVPRTQANGSTRNHQRPPRFGSSYTPTSQPECRMWVATNGHCRFGSECRYRHPVLPARQHDAQRRPEAPSKNEVPPRPAYGYPW